MPVSNPATDKLISTVAMGNAVDADKSVMAAKIAFESFSRTSTAGRLSLLCRLKVITEKRLEDLAQATRLHVIIETNEGLQAAFEIARCSDRADAMFPVAWIWLPTCAV